MNCAIVICHNKTPEANIAQIEALKPLIEKQSEVHDELNENGEVVGQFETYYYTLKGLDGYKVKLYQILPYQPDNPRLAQGLPYEGVWPANANDIDSHRVAYGKGDEDKTGDHKRFQNWGLKRATDQGADVVIHLKDHTKFNVADLSSRLSNLPKQAQVPYGTISRKDDTQVKE